MLSKDGVVARYIFAFSFFFLSGSEMITGGLATLSGIMGCVELATALLRYSPLNELYQIRQEKAKTSRAGNSAYKSPAKHR